MRKINSFLPTELLAQASRYDAITQLLRASLPERLAQHAWYGGTLGEHIIVITDSGNWVTPLRFEQASILAHLRNEAGINAVRISIKVSPDPIPSER